MKYNIIGSSDGSTAGSWFWIGDTFSQHDNYKQVFAGQPPIPTGNAISDNLIITPNVPMITSDNNRTTEAEFNAANPNGAKSLQHQLTRNSDGTYTNSVDITWPNSVTITNGWQGQDVVIDMPPTFVGINAAVRLS